MPEQQKLKAKQTNYWNEREHALLYVLFHTGAGKLIGQFEEKKEKLFYDSERGPFESTLSLNMWRFYSIKFVVLGANSLIL